MTSENENKTAERKQKLSKMKQAPKSMSKSGLVRIAFFRLSHFLIYVKHAVISKIGFDKGAKNAFVIFASRYEATS